MWLEVKATITIIGIVIIVIALALTGNIIIDILALMGIFTIIFGDFLIGWKIVNNDAVNIIDPCGPNERIIDLHLIGGGRRIMKGTKKAMGKIDFIFEKAEASVIDDGKYPIHFSNGNQGVIAHELLDRNVDLYELEFLNKASEDLNAEDIKAMRAKILELRKNKEEGGK